MSYSRNTRRKHKAKENREKRSKDPHSNQDVSPQERMFTRNLHRLRAELQTRLPEDLDKKQYDRAVLEGKKNFFETSGNLHPSRRALRASMNDTHRPKGAGSKPPYPRSRKKNQRRRQEARDDAERRSREMTRPEYATFRRGRGR